MPLSTSTETEREQRLNAVLLTIVQSMERGESPDRPQLLTDHPEFTTELEEFFASRDFVNRIAVQRPTGQNPRDPLADTSVLGDFRILREVGRGGMGIVYEALQTSLDRRVALKVLPGAGTVDSRRLQRFQNEAHAAALLQHPHIVPIYSVGCERQTHFYAMQFIDGQSLAAVIGALRQSVGSELPIDATVPPTGGSALPQTPNRRALTSPMPPPQAEPIPRTPTTQASTPTLAVLQSNSQSEYFHGVARLGLSAAAALDHAHQLGVVHRDIKPANLLLDARGHLWITDFGVAMLQNTSGPTVHGEVVGTLRYMSPEQASANRGLVDHRTDIYSLGATLYELLTLRPPFPSNEPGKLIQQICSHDAAPPRSVNPSIPQDLETIVLKAIQKNQHERYPTAQALADDLQRFLDRRPILARRPSVADHARKWMRRHPSIVAAGLLLLVCGVVGFAISTAMIAREQAETKKAYDQEHQRAAEAEERLQLARRLADDMIRIADEEAPDDPRQQHLRQRLLLSAIGYYQQFIELRRGNPAAQSELEETQRLVRTFLDDLAVIQGGERHMLLSRSSVQRDLQLSLEQRERLDDVFRDIIDRGPVDERDLPRMSAESRSQQLLRDMRAHESAIARILTSAQLIRLEQIALQSRGLQAFQEPEVVAVLELTRDQRDQLSAMTYGPDSSRRDRASRGPDSDANRRTGFDPNGDRGDGPPSRPSARLSQSGVSGPERDRALRILTSEQRIRWQELTGRPFTDTSGATRDRDRFGPREPDRGGGDRPPPPPENRFRDGPPRF